jgi:hypothetical protein
MSKVAVSVTSIFAPAGTIPHRSYGTRVAPGLGMRSLLHVTATAALLGAITASPAFSQDQAPPTDSVSAISAAVSIGQRIAIRDDSGRRVRGILASISSDSIVILRERRRFFRRSITPETFPPHDVDHIEVIDSTWQGRVIGAAAGVTATALIVAAARNDGNGYEPLLWLFPGPLLAVGGSAIGGAIDGAHNRTAYERRPVRSTRTLALPPSWSHLAVMARVSF